jgi:hypothetical protein
MKMVLLGAVGVLALQALLVVGFPAVNRANRIVLNPESPLDLSGIAMVMFCGEGRTPQGRGSGVLEKMPPQRRRGRVVAGKDGAGRL